ncbi:hypothetical protein PHLCEN_2v5215 [Hermanssonia centrifuga]|uniref:CCHC-type domain-containing protein n=1 Tax=Hermanssonia centrifuga TaxID=98765 RepID=A0A2R6P8Q4_9APHY|nr:hypothetical protein PHLCEN_2v5215 [Hermanssonia centrifuga]
MTCYNCNGKGHLSAKCPSPCQPRPTAHAAAATANTNNTTSSKPATSTPTTDANATISFDNSVWSAMADTKVHAEDGRTYTEIWDSGATAHISPYRWMFDSFEEHTETIHIADKSTVQVIGRGTMVICAPYKNGMAKDTSSKCSLLA